MIPGPSPLDEHVRRLLAWVEERHGIPPWEAPLVLDASDPRVRWVAGARPGWRLLIEVLVPVEAYRARFEHHLRQGHAWINLGLHGIFGASLIVGVELPNGSRRVPIGHTSVNYFGPSSNPRTGLPEWALHLEVVPGEGAT